MSVQYPLSEKNQSPLYKRLISVIKRQKQIKESHEIKDPLAGARGEAVPTPIVPAQPAKSIILNPTLTRKEINAEKEAILAEEKANAAARAPQVRTRKSGSLFDSSPAPVYVAKNMPDSVGVVLAHDNDSNNTPISQSISEIKEEPMTRTVPNLDDRLEPELSQTSRWNEFKLVSYEIGMGLWMGVELLIYIGASGALDYYSYQGGKYLGERNPKIEYVIIPVSKRSSDWEKYLTPEVPIVEATKDVAPSFTITVPDTSKLESAVVGKIEIPQINLPKIEEPKVEVAKSMPLAPTPVENPLKIVGPFDDYQIKSVDPIKKEITSSSGKVRDLETVLQGKLDALNTKLATCDDLKGYFAAIASSGYKSNNMAQYTALCQSATNKQ